MTTPRQGQGARADVLVTGGAGYIGSTIVSALTDAGHHPVVLDDLSAGSREFLRGRDAVVGDVGDRTLIRRLLRDRPGVATVVHCAAKVVVPESTRAPAAYYRTNVAATLALAETLLECGVTRLVFSGSASIYAASPDLAVDESSAWAPASPYARTKAAAEMLLADLASASPLRVLTLRYFNPVGADPWMRSGPHREPPSHVLGRLMEADRTGMPFSLTGVDYPTADGTPIRDYVHVWDLARAHVAAVRGFDRALATRPYDAIDLGTGTGTTVRQLVAAYEQVTGRRVRLEEASRRAGDTAGVVGRSTKADRVLGWRPSLGLVSAIADALAWSESRASSLGREAS